MTENVCTGDDCHQKSIKMFWRQECKWCELLKPLFLELKGEHPEIDFELVEDTVNFKAGKGLFTSYPTIVGYDEHQKEVKKTDKEIVVKKRNDGSQITEANGKPIIDVVNTKGMILNTLSADAYVPVEAQKTIADLSVMELVKERDRRIFEVQQIEIELNKRK